MMSDNKSNSLMSFQKGQGKNTDKIAQLKRYVQQSEYIEVLEQIAVCKSFGLPYLVKVFRAEYRQRFYDFLHEHATTVAMASLVTKIPHKYLCEVKAYYEKKDLLKVIYKDYCPVTNSSNVQFVSTNKDIWNDLSLLPETDQLKLF